MGKKLIAGCALLLSLAAGTLVWRTLAGTTRIAFVNYQAVALGQIAKSNDSPRIAIEELPSGAFDRLRRYDMVFINGMGLRITGSERALVAEAARRGVPVLTTAATNPANDICSLDSLDAAALKGYLAAGGRRNYRSMLRYVRTRIDGKRLFVGQPEAAVARTPGLLYHADPQHPDAEELEFGSVAEYEAFLGRSGTLRRHDAPAILLTGAMGEPADLVRRFEQAGYRVYPVRDIYRFVRQGHADSVAAEAVVDMAHGRMGDRIAAYLRERNIPLFATLHVNRPVEEWERDPMGMSGGFLSQSVVMPEIDGAIRPYALFGHYRDAEGLPSVRAIPERLETFVETVGNYIALRRKPNSEKRVAIYYYKGPGRSALTAAGMEVAPSLYNLLLRMKREGYRIEGLPSSAAGLERLIQQRGAVFNAYAAGAAGEYLRSGDPVLVGREEYASWVERALRPEKYAETVAAFGDFPGQYMATDDGRLCVTRIDLGNVVLLPQPAAGVGGSSFEIVHGTNAAPPHPYLASYLWTQFGFKADAMIHFGTHGSLEFTPGKQVALSGSDWPDRLVGALPHFYVYSIGNVGEGMIAKRRAYAGLQSHLTPPFMESGVGSIYGELREAVRRYDAIAGGDAPDPAAARRASLAVKKLAVELGLHRDLGLDSLPETPYTEAEINRIENFAEELVAEKVTGPLYTLGTAYEPALIAGSVSAMTVDPIAYSLLALDKLRGRAAADAEKHRARFTARYLEPARALVQRLLADPGAADDALICRTASLTPAELARAREIQRAQQPQTAMPPTSPAAAAGMRRKQEYTQEELRFARAVAEAERAIRSVGSYRTALQESPERELASMINALNGGYTPPSPGGDPVANPNTLPTGRNLYAVNAEAAPSESAWEKGVALANSTIETYRRRHHDSIPRKVGYTLWSGEFIETEGATIAQVLYMLGVEPVRDAFGRVADLRLIPSAELGRPRIDVVVQTSGQLRDIAASRLFLINRAVEMAAAATGDLYENRVSAGVVETERMLIEKGLTPKEARETATFRVFGGVNGSYGTGIQGMVQSGGRWEREEEIAGVYLNNMNAFYGSEKQWETVRRHAFEAALTRTDAVIQPRQSNTWGALSLDHVYEFMGGMNLAVRSVTGKDPDAYLSDYRNRSHVRMQEVREAIGAESRTTIFNPTWIREKMKGGAGSAALFAELVQNVYGWSVTKPAAVGKQLWDGIYDVCIDDRFALGTKEFFTSKNPAALEEMTAVMLEAVRKGMWRASERQTADLAALHTELVNEYGPSCSGSVCDNAPLRQFIASKSDPEAAAAYLRNIDRIREAQLSSGGRSVVMQREELSHAAPTKTRTVSGAAAAGIVLLVIAAAAVMIRKRKR